MNLFNHHHQPLLPKTTASCSRKAEWKCLGYDGNGWGVVEWRQDLTSSCCCLTNLTTTRHPSTPLQAPPRPPGSPSAREQLEVGLGHQQGEDQCAGPVGFGLVGGGLARCAEVKGTTTGRHIPHTATVLCTTTLVFTTTYGAHHHFGVHDHTLLCSTTKA